MNKVNIKGCAGFIGSNLASLMLNEGYTVGYLQLSLLLTKMI